MKTMRNEENYLEGVKMVECLTIMMWMDDGQFTMQQFIHRFRHYALSAACLAIVSEIFWVKYLQ